MTSRDLRAACAPTTATIREALEVIDRSATSVCLLVDDGRLTGLLTDGDLRRAFLHGASLEDPALQHATTDPKTVDAGTTRALVLDLMRAVRISVVPEVDATGLVIGLHTLSDVVGASPRDNVAVIMAGGKGTRLGALTKHTPKPLMTVAGRSIIEWIILNLVGDGIRDIYVSVNHLAEQIEEHLGDGGRLGCRVRYLREEPDKPLGTAGSLTLLHAERPDLADPVIVMNGDLMVQFEASALLETHRSQGAAITMATRTYQHEVPFGVVESEGGTSDRGRREANPDLRHQRRRVCRGAVGPRAPPRGRAEYHARLVEMCLQRGSTVAAWPISTDWIDVGTPTDLARAKGQA